MGCRHCSTGEGALARLFADCEVDLVVRGKSA